MKEFILFDVIVNGVVFFIYLSAILLLVNRNAVGGAWVAQSVKPPTVDLAQVMISQFMSLSPSSSSVLTAGSLIGILSLPLPCLCAHSLSHSLSLKINK